MDNSAALNDYFQSLIYSSSLSFRVSLYGAALIAPDGVSTSGTAFAFSLYSDVAGTVPALTSDTTNGFAFTININLDGTATVTNSGGTAITIQVTQTTQTTQNLTFGTLANTTFTTTPLTLGAAASSGLPVSFASNTPGICTVSGNSVALQAAGTCSITASQQGTPTIAAAPLVTQTFTVSQASQSITFAPLPDQTISAMMPTLSASASSGLPVAYTSNSASICTVSGSTVTLVGAGTCSITASQTGSAAYSAATSATQTFKITGLTAQTITFGMIAGQTYSTTPLSLTGTASSGLVVGYVSNTTSVCTVSGAAVTLVTVGTCSITASQAGSTTYAAATPVNQTFTVGQAAQTISFGAIAAQTVGNPLTVTATASSGLAVAFASTTTSVCTVAGGAVSFASTGTCSITASQAGNSNYAAATPVGQSFLVNPAAQTITFGALPDTALGGSVALYATASSQLPVAFTSTTASVCTVSTVTIAYVALVSMGTCSITASQSGNATYAAATPVTRSFTVLKPGQTITFAFPGNQSLGTTPPALIATATSGLTVSFTSTTTSVCTVNISSLTLVAVGTCSITASQAGNANYSAATPTSQSFQVVSGGNTTTTLSSSLNPAAYGQTVTLTATVAPSAATGSVTFFDGTNTLGTGYLSGGKATLTVYGTTSGTTFPVGQHSLTAVFTATGSTYASSASAVLTQTVSKASSTTTLTTPYACFMCTSTTLQAAIVPLDATGTITFRDGTTVLGTTGLGTNYFSVTNTPGIHSYTATYSGDTNYLSSTSAPVTQTIVGVSLTSSPNPSVLGQSVSVTATVVPATATGTVTFSDSGASLGTSPLTAGTASIALTTLAAGTHYISASYGGDSATPSAVSPAIQQQVWYPVALKLSSSRNPAPIGTPVTLSVTVYGTANTFMGAVPSSPTGIVSFMDGATVVGTATLSTVSCNGMATCQSSASLALSTLASGSHSFSVAYPGDSSYPAGTSATLIEKVPSITSTTTLSLGTNPSLYGQSVTLTATVSPSVATGTVMFYDGISLLGTGTLNSGTATLKTSALGYGTRSVSAHYLGSETYISSTSAATTAKVGTLPANGFQSAVSYPVGNSANLVVADFNGDGFADLAGPSGTTGVAVAVLLGKGDGTFKPAISAATGTTPGTLFAGDFNGDGRVDLIANIGTSGTLRVFPGNGDGTFGSPIDSVFGISGSSASLALADFNGDGILDVAIPVVGSSYMIAIMLGNGDGTFQSAVTSSSGQGYGTPTAGDFNGDGHADLAIITSGYVVVLLGNGDGTLQKPVNYATGYAQHSILAADLNGDGNLDLLVTQGDAGNSGAVMVLLGNGNGTFRSAVTYNVSFIAWVVSVGDFNGDGKADLVIANSDYSGTTTSILIGNGDGTFQPAVTYPSGTNNVSVATGDFNGDGRTDLAVGSSSSGAIAVFLAKPIPVTTVALTSSPSPSNYGQAVTVTAKLSPTTATGQIDFYDGNTLLGALTVSNGQAAFSTGLLAAGSHAISATYSGDASNGASTSAVLTHTVKPLAASTVTLASSANPTTYGALITLAATVTPASSTGAVTFYDGAQPLGTATLASGLAVFKTTGLASGTRSLKAVYGGDSLRNPATSAILTETVQAVKGYGFYPARNYPGGSGPIAIAAGDFNGDGIPDLATADSAWTIKILIGRADGSFSAPVSYSVGSTPYDVEVADFNRDGILDLVVPNYGDNNVTILLGRGDGTFLAGVNYGAGVQPASVAVSDFNGDGKADLAVANEGGPVSILLGNGDGTFQAAVSYPVGTIPVSIIAADFNQDGKPDIAIANYGDNTVSVLIGNGDGSFQSATTWTAGGGPGAVTSGDFNGDGRTDVAVANTSDGTVGILLGNGNGTFKAITAYAVGKGPNSIRAGDFNGDGKTDLATTGPTSGAGAASVLLGNGDGTFQTYRSYPTGTSSWAITLGDFNGDGRQDMAVANFGSNTVSILLGAPPSPNLTVSMTHTGQFLVGQNNTYSVTVANAGQAATAGTVTLTDTFPPGMTAISMTGTGWTCSLTSRSCQRPDALAAGSAYPAVTITVSVAGSAASTVVNTVTVSGGGEFDTTDDTATDRTTFASQALSVSLASSANPSTLGQPITLTATVSSASASGRIEFLSGVQTIGTASLVSGVATLATGLLGSGKQVLTATYPGSAAWSASSSSGLTQTVNSLPQNGFASPSNLAGGSGPASIAAADFNGDGFPDLAIASYAGVTVFLGRIDGAFAAGTTFAAGFNPFAIVAGDFNGDGRPDLAVANVYSGGVGVASVLVGNGDGTFQPPVAYTTGYESSSLVAADLNADGTLDLVVGNQGDGTVSVLLGNGDGTFQTAANSAGNDYPTDVRIGDFNGDGKPDLVVVDYGQSGRAKLIVYLGNGDGTFGAPLPLSLGYGPWTAAVGDLNGDGKADLAVADADAGTLIVLLGNGDGTFKSPTTYTAGNSPYSLVISDFTGDSVPDVAIANAGDNTVMVFPGKGDGTFGASTSYSVNKVPYGLVAGDWNRDGRTDLATANHSSNDVTILLGTGPKASQTITFSSLASVVYGSGPVTLRAAASSGLSVTLTSTTTTVCTVSGNTVTLVAGGTCSITATQAGNANYNAASAVVQSFTITPQSQTISFGSLNNVAIGSAPFSVTAAATSGLPVSFTSTTTGVCTVSGTTITVSAVGTCSVTANQTGNASYSAAPAITQTFTVATSVQTISFAALANVVFGTAPFTISATASSGLSVTLTSGTTGVCTVAGTTVTLVSVGTCTITASQDGNATVSAANPIMRSFTVSPGSQTISFPSLPNASLGGSAITLSATASSGLPVSFASTTALVCTVSGAAVTLVATGTCSITASQAGNANYGAATPVVQSFTVSPATQTITFSTLASVPFGTSPITLGATASSGLAVSYASTTPSVCTVSGTTATLAGLGTCSITASQAGNAGFVAAASVTQSFTVTKATQTITFGTIPATVYGTAAIQLSATASSGLTVSYTSTTPGVCTISNTSVVLVAVGTCSINASQAGNANYSAATAAPQSFSITQATQTVTFLGLPAKTYSSTPFAILATASSGLAVAFTSSTPSVCTVTGGTVALVSVGSCSLTASQPGNNNYSAAASVTQSFTVSQATQSITFNAPWDVTVDTPSVPLNAVASSGLPVTVSSGTPGVCTVSGNLVTPTAAGTCTLTASQTGNQNYSTAQPVTQGFVVASAPDCSYSLSQGVGSVPVGGGQGSFSVSTGYSCTWTAVSNSSWISISKSGGVGSGTVQYVTSSNTGSAARSGSITAGGLTYNVVQFGQACSFALSTSSINAPAYAVPAFVQVYASQNACAFTATSSDPTNLVVSPASGIAPTQVTLGITANTGATSRSFTATIGGQTVQVNQAGVNCTISLSSSSASFGASGGPGSEKVTLPSGCNYGTVTGPNWITINSGGSGGGPGGSLYFSVDPNPTTAPRKGTLEIGGQAFQVTEQGLACDVAIDTSGLGSPFAAAGGSGTIAVTTSNQACSWTATTGAGWLVVSSPGGGTGNGTVTVTGAANAASGPRTGQVRIGGRTVNVGQAGTTCDFALRSTNGSVAAAGGSGTVGVVAASGCAWSATSNATWLTVTSGAGLSGTADAQFSATANATASTRTGTLTVAGQSYTVSQGASACPYSLSLAGISAPVSGATGTVTFTTSVDGCTPSAVSNTNWLPATTTFSGRSGTFTYTASANGGGPRVGIIKLGGQSFTVNEAGATCTYTLGASGAEFGQTAGSGSIAITASAAGCTPVVSISPGSPQSVVTLGTLAGPVGNTYTQPFTVSAFNSASGSVRLVQINIGGTIYLVKQTSW